MNTPDPDTSISYDPADTVAGELIQNDSEGQDIDPLNVLLTENTTPDPDDERLYTDEFIRANENASRSLFLGFLGISLLATSLFAWFILSRPKTDDTENRQEPVSVPSLPPNDSPTINTVPTIPLPDQAPVPNSTPQNPNPAASPQSPLVFPVTPVTPNSSITPAQPQSPAPTPAVPDGSVPPPPPVTSSP